MLVAPPAEPAAEQGCQECRALGRDLAEKRCSPVLPGQGHHSMSGDSDRGQPGPRLPDRSAGIRHIWGQARKSGQRVVVTQVPRHPCRVLLARTMKWGFSRSSLPGPWWMCSGCAIGAGHGHREPKPWHWEGAAEPSGVLRAGQPGWLCCLSLCWEAAQFSEELLIWSFDHAWVQGFVYFWLVL